MIDNNPMPRGLKVQASGSGARRVGRSSGRVREGVMSNRGPAKRVSRSKAEQRAETLEQIYDAAEYLFSVHGLHGVTLRDVAQRVGVHTTLLHYYFKDKRELFAATFARRAPISVNRRMAAMQRYEEEAGDKVTVEGALHAFLDTDLEL